MVYHPHIGVLYIYIFDDDCIVSNVYLPFVHVVVPMSISITAVRHVFNPHFWHHSYIFVCGVFFCGDAENTILFIVIRLSLIRYIFTPSNVFIFDRKRK